MRQRPLKPRNENDGKGTNIYYQSQQPQQQQQNLPTTVSRKRIVRHRRILRRYRSPSSVFVTNKAFVLWSRWKKTIANLRRNIRISKQKWICYWRKQNQSQQCKIGMVILLIVVILVWWLRWGLMYWLFRKRHIYRLSNVPIELLFGNVAAVRAHYQNMYGYIDNIYTNDDLDEPIIQSPAFDDFQSPPIAMPTIFYNIYIPKNHEQGYQHAIDIVKEQLQQIVTGLKLDQVDYTPSQGIYVYCNTIGQAIVHTTIQQLCHEIHPNLHCTLLKHYINATETVTLQSLHDYCSNNKNFIKEAHDNSNSNQTTATTATTTTTTTNQVIYLHTKGSYHDNTVNAVWRRALTDAALYCTMYQSYRPDRNHCNLCGLQFFTQFTFFIPGNMWMADCAYVRQLLPPDSRLYQQKRYDVVHKFLVLRLRNHMRSHLLRDRKDYFGLDRYNAEHWIGSHVDVVPCDVYPPEHSLSDLFRQSIEQIHHSFQWSLAPRHVGFAVGNVFRGHQHLASHPQDRLREYYLLPGHILKWYALYGKVPDETSWVWKWFPDGELWYDAIQQYGEAAIEIVTAEVARKDERAMTLPDNTPSFRSRSGMDKPSDVFIKHSSETVAFYHIVFPQDDIISMDAMVTTWQRIKMQLQLVATSKAAQRETIILFFNVVSMNADIKDQVLALCQDHATLKCHAMQQLDQNYNGETLQMMYNYCTTFPPDYDSPRLLYLNNEGPNTILKNDTHLLDELVRFMTVAATDYCLDQSQDSSTCNVCGLAFYTMWTLFFPGTIFASTCSYIIKLIPPNQFEKKWENAIGEILVAILRGHISSNILYRQRIDTWGMGRYAIESWIASHPDLDPCDAAYSEQYEWSTIDRIIVGQGVSRAPHIEGPPISNFSNATADYEVQHKTDLRQREYQFLAGHLIKWYSLYNKAPSHDSWAWGWFPDGIYWRNGVLYHGRYVVDILNTNEA